VILENIKKNICARLIDDFDFASETAENQLGNAGVSCDVTRSQRCQLLTVKSS